MLGKTKEQQSTPKKEEVYNWFKCLMSHSVTSELKLDRKEEFKVVLEHWTQFKQQHSRAFIEHYLDPAKSQKSQDQVWKYILHSLKDSCVGKMSQVLHLSSVCGSPALLILLQIYF